MITVIRVGPTGVAEVEEGESEQADELLHMLHEADHFLAQLVSSHSMCPCCFAKSLVNLLVARVDNGFIPHANGLTDSENGTQGIYDSDDLVQFTPDDDAKPH